MGLFSKKQKVSPSGCTSGQRCTAPTSAYELHKKDLSRLHRAAARGDLAWLRRWRWWLKMVGINSRDKEERTLLHLACANGHVDVVRFLLGERCQLNLSDNCRRSPLMKAVQCQQEECVAILLQHGASPDLQDADGNTALHLAVLSNNINTVLLLLEHYADVDVENKEGCTALMLAVSEHHKEIAEILLKTGADVRAPYRSESLSKQLAGSADQDSSGEASAGGAQGSKVLGGPHWAGAAGFTLGASAVDRGAMDDLSEGDSVRSSEEEGNDDDWNGSEEELHFTPKKQQKPDMRLLMDAFQQHRKISALPAVGAEEEEDACSRWDSEIPSVKNTEESDPEREKDLLYKKQSLQDEAAMLRLELDQMRLRHQEEEAKCLEENKTLKEENEDLKKELKLNEESMQEQLAQLQRENLSLHQQLEDMQNKQIIKENVLSVVQECFIDIYNKVRADTGKQVYLLEERNKELNAKCADLGEQVSKYEIEKVEREDMVRQLQQQLADALKKQCVSEALLEDTTCHRRDQQEEKLGLQKELEEIKTKLQEWEEQRRQPEHCVHGLEIAFDDKERQLRASSQKLRDLQLASSGTNSTIKQLEEHVQRLEMENARLQATVQQQSNTIEALQRDLQASTSRKQLNSSTRGLKQKLDEIKNTQEDTIFQKEFTQAEMEKHKEAYLEDVQIRECLENEQERSYAALQGRSIYSDWQFYGSCWITKEEGLPLSQAEEMDHLLRPRPPSDNDLKDSNGKIHVPLSESVRKKIVQKRMELLQRGREKPFLLLRQSIDPEDAGTEGIDPLPVNGTASMFPSTTSACRENTATALSEQVNRPLLPSLPVVKQGGSFLHNNSENSSQTISLEPLECGEETGFGDAQEARPFSHPQEMLLSAFTLLSSNSWEQQVKGFFIIRDLAICHSEVLLPRLHDVSVAISKEVKNQHSKVAHSAVVILGELFETLKHHMDQEVDGIASVLLQKTGDCRKFIQEAASQSLGVMVVNVTPAQAMNALMATGVGHCNALVRKCAAKHLLTVVEHMGAKKLLSDTCDRTELLLRTLVKLAQDRHQDTRCYGQQMLRILRSHPKFDRYLQQPGLARDLEEIMATIKKRGKEDRNCEAPSTTDHRESKKSNLETSQDKLPAVGGLKSGPGVCTVPHQEVPHTSVGTVEDTEQLLELKGLLTSQEFQSRMKALELLLDHCKSSPQFIVSNISQIFGGFVLTLRDYHKKVSQQALEVLALMIPMFRGTPEPAMVHLVTAALDSLNSKDSGIYAAAVEALEASVAHLDTTSLLRLFGTRVPYLQGQALLDVSKYLSVLVESSYRQKPETVQRYALPALWHLLGNKALPVLKPVVTKIAKSLYQVMGSRLKKQAAKQPPHVVKNLKNILEIIGED